MELHHPPAASLPTSVERGSLKYIGDFLKNGESPLCQAAMRPTIR